MLVFRSSARGSLAAAFQLFTPRIERSTLAAIGAAAILGSLAGCASGPYPAAPVVVRDPVRPAAATPPAPPATSGALPAPGLTGSVQRTRARWVPASWSELPGWQLDQPAQAWSALLASCARPAPEAAAAWGPACARARALQAAGTPSDGSIRAWMQEQLQPWRIEDLDGRSDGLLTGYFEPLVEAQRHAGGAYTWPLHAPPPGLAERNPWWTRAEQATPGPAREALRGRELAYVADPLDALMLQIQGSGRVRLLDENGADGRPRVVRLAFAGHNGQPYRSIGRWLVDQGELTLEQASWPAIRAWARLHPERQDELLHANPRVVFFREEALSATTGGPLGAQGVPLTPGRSIAVDRDSIPLGTPVWIVSTEPQAWAPADSAPLPRPLQRLVIAQDTGGAIVGAVRADYFWGWGEGTESQAGRTKQPLRMWALWPRG